MRMKEWLVRLFIKTVDILHLVIKSVDTLFWISCILFWCDVLFIPKYEGINVIVLFYWSMTISVIYNIFFEISNYRKERKITDKLSKKILATFPYHAYNNCYITKVDNGYIMVGTIIFKEDCNGIHTKHLEGSFDTLEILIEKTNNKFFLEETRENKLNGILNG